MPSQNIIEQFISENVVAQKILARYLVATNETELRNNGSFVRLVRFVRKAFKIHYKDGDTKKIKDLDMMTKDLAIPSRSGHNLASSLMVYHLKNFTFCHFLPLFIKSIFFILDTLKCLV